MHAAATRAVAGGREGNPAQWLWELGYEQAFALKLESRIDQEHFR
jgi:hypothetical protein